MSEVAEIVAGLTYRSEGYGMYVEYMPDSRGDPTVEVWAFETEDSGCDGSGWLEITVHEIVVTEKSGTLAVYYRQWFAPTGEPAWGSRPKRAIGSIGSLKALLRRRNMIRAALASGD